MIGSGLKKLAKENGMVVSNGIAYGFLGGYAATLCEGAGYKQIVFSTRFVDPAGQVALQNAIRSRNLQKEFRVQNLLIEPRTVFVRFLDNPGTMKKIRAFLDWFLPMMHHYGASLGNVCTECGYVIEQGQWAMVNGIAYYFHTGCAEHVHQQILAGNAQRAEENKGSYLTGLIGALLGSVVGAVLWALVMSWGYIASIVGLAMGWMADKGYNLLKGKQGKGKVAILLVCVIMGVVLGTFASDAITLFSMIQSGELYNWSVADIPAIIVMLLAEDTEYRGAVLGNILTGLLFAGLGVFALLRKTGKDVSGAQYIDL